MNLSVEKMNLNHHSTAIMHFVCNFVRPFHIFSLAFYTLIIFILYFPFSIVKDSFISKSWVEIGFEVGLVLVSGYSMIGVMIGQHG